MLAGLAISAGVPAPRLALIDDSVPNAYAVGRRPEEVVVAVTSGLLEQLSRDEIEAVLSHTMSRIPSLDIALSTWAVALTGHTIELWERTERKSVKIGLFVSKLLAERLRSFALRGQTAQQDMLAVRFTRNPRSLLDALVKLESNAGVVRSRGCASAPLWIEYPYWDGSSLGERIAALRELVEPGRPAPGRGID